MKGCNFCGSSVHTQFSCPVKPRKTLSRGTKQMKSGGYLKPESKKKKTNRQATTLSWHQQNPPDVQGNWVCYLQISPRCPRLLDMGTLVLEHVFSKKRRPDLRYEPKNIRPACDPCNELKGSKNGEDVLSAQQYSLLKMEVS